MSLKGITYEGKDLKFVLKNRHPEASDKEIIDMIREENKSCIIALSSRHSRVKYADHKEPNGPVRYLNRLEIIKEQFMAPVPSKELYELLLLCVEENGPIGTKKVSALAGETYPRVQSRLTYIYKRLLRLGYEGFKRKPNPHHAGHGYFYYFEPGATAQEALECIMTNKGVRILGNIEASDAEPDGETPKSHEDFTTSDEKEREVFPLSEYQREYYAKLKAGEALPYGRHRMEAIKHALKAEEKPGNSEVSIERSTPTESAAVNAEAATPLTVRTENGEVVILDDLKKVLDNALRSVIDLRRNNQEDSSIKIDVNVNFSFGSKK
jgi:hypothetical protein